MNITEKTIASHNMTSYNIKADLLEHAAPTNRPQNGWAIVRWLKRCFLGEEKETSRIILGTSQIACKTLVDSNITCDMNELKLNWYEKRYFIPVNIVNKYGTTRVLMNKSSFLKNYKMSPQRKALIKNVFDRNVYAPEDFALLQQAFNNQLFVIQKYPSTPQDISQVSQAINTLNQSGVGSAKKPNTKNTTHVDMIVRTAMRHPCQESRELLTRLHQAIKSKFIKESDEGLNWLISSTFHANEARGGFASADGLRKFLNQDPKTIPSSRLITGIETLLTAIAYKAVFPPRKLSPKETQIYKICIKIKPLLSPCLNKIYPDKYDLREYTKQSLDSKTEILGEERAELSDVSDAEENLPKQKRVPRVAFLRSKQDGNTRTWAYCAQLSNVPVRYGVSGTTTLNLATAQWLLSDTNSPITEKELQLLAGTVIIPNYHRADYHSVAEVMVGLQRQMDHYLKITPKILSPQKALEEGLRLVAEATDPQFRNETNVLSKEIMRHTHLAKYTHKKVTKTPSKFLYLS